jgi:hypothetical protein
MELRNRAAGAYYMKFTKGQEEIMGFILIVVIVMVIGLGMLFFFSPRAAETSDLEMQNLLYAWVATDVDGSVSGAISSCSGTCDLATQLDILDKAITKSGIINQINGYSLNVTGMAEAYYEKGIVKGNSTRTAVVQVDSENTAKLRFYYP